MIAATFDAGAVADRLAELPSQADSALRDAATDLVARLWDRADSKISGDVLNARTGALRASLAATVDPSSRISAKLTADTPYAAFQEYGFSGTETVRAHLRQMSQAFGRAIRPVTATVRAHERCVDYPAHSYLRSTLAELGPDIRLTLAAAVDGALNP